MVREDEIGSHGTWRVFSVLEWWNKCYVFSQDINNVYYNVYQMLYRFNIISYTTIWRRQNMIRVCKRPNAKSIWPWPFFRNTYFFVSLFREMIGWQCDDDMWEYYLFEQYVATLSGITVIFYSREYFMIGVDLINLMEWLFNQIMDTLTIFKVFRWG